MYVAVGQKLPCLLIEVLGGGFFDEFTLVVKLPEYFRGCLVVDLVGGAGIDIERDTELFEGGSVHFMITIHYLLRGDTLLPCFERYRHTVFVGAAYMDHLSFAEAKVTGVNIGRYINTCQVAYMDGAVGIWKGRGIRYLLNFFIG